MRFSLDRCVLLGLVLSLRFLLVWTLNLTMPNLSLSSNSTLTVSDRLVSAPLGYFELGIIQFGDKYQLCIRYAAPVEQVVVWVAQRDTPLSKNAYLHVSSPSGILQLFDPATDLDPNRPLWSTDTNPGEVAHTAQLNDAGNLVLMDKNGTTLWDSFKNGSVTDTLLPGKSFNQSDNSNLTSWSKNGDPASGFYTFGWGTHPNDQAEVFLQLAWQSPKKFMTWQGAAYIPAVDESGPSAKGSGASSVFWYAKTGNVMTKGTRDAGTIFLQGGSDLTNPKTLKRLTIDVDGGLRLYQFQVGQSSNWSVVANWIVDYRKSQCFTIGTCGQYSICTTSVATLERVQCSCVEGFKPLYDNDTSRGCTHEAPLTDCNATDSSRIEYVQINDLDFPWAGDSKTLIMNDPNGCRDGCLRDCNCAGAVYGQNDTASDKNFCWMKSGPLENLGYPTRSLHSVSRIAWIKKTPVLGTPLPLPAPEQPKAEANRTGLIIGLSVLCGVLLIVAGVLSAYILKRMCGGAGTNAPLHPPYTGPPDPVD